MTTSIGSHVETICFFLFLISCDSPFLGKSQTVRANTIFPPDLEAINHWLSQVAAIHLESSLNCSLLPNLCILGRNKASNSLAEF